jgi:hypothetical protein
MITQNADDSISVSAGEWEGTLKWFNQYITDNNIDVDNKGTYITENLTFSIYDMSYMVHGLGIEKGAEVNKIDSVSEVFEIRENRQLDLTAATKESLELANTAL